MAKNIAVLHEMNGTTAKESTQIIEIEEVKDTPFHLVHHDNGYFLALGKYRLSNDVDKKEEALELLDREFWRILIDTIIALLQTFNNESSKNYLSSIDSSITSTNEQQEA